MNLYLEDDVLALMETRELKGLDHAKEKENMEEEKMETNTNDERLIELEKEISELKDELARIRNEAVGELQIAENNYMSSDAEALYTAYRMAYRTGFCDAMDYVKGYNDKEEE